MHAHEIYDAQGVMLAEASKFDVEGARRLSDTHSFELKWDGVRCLVHYKDGVVSMRSRTGKPMTHKYPDLVSVFQAMFDTAEVLLDGEVIAFDADGKPTFNAIQQRDSCSDPKKIAARADSNPAVFVAFDVLHIDEEDVRDKPWWMRREKLEAFYKTFAHPQTIISPVTIDPEPLMALVVQQGLEGVMAKHRTAIYRGGRRKSWLKIKAIKSLTAVVTGYEDGLGSRASTFGALNLALVQSDGTLLPVGKAGTGFKQRDLDAILPRLQAGEELYVEVNYLEFTGEALRFPVYKGVREDVTRDNCGLSQIAAAVLA